MGSSQRASIKGTPAISHCKEKRMTEHNVNKLLEQKDLSIDEAVVALEQVLAAETSEGEITQPQTQNDTGLETGENRPVDEDPLANNNPDLTADTASLASLDEVRPSQPAPLARIIELLQPKFPEVQNPEGLLQLAESHPERFAQYQAHLLALAHTLQQKEEREAEAARQFFKQQVQELVRLIPDLKGQGRLASFFEEIGGYMAENGMQPEKVRNAAANEIQVIHKAMLWDKAEKDRKSARQRADEATSVQVPGTGDVEQSGYREALTKLKSTGRLDDASRALSFLFDKD